jgi:hypothetical protein
MFNRTSDLMGTFLRILSRVFAVIGIGIIAMISIIWVDGQDLTDPGGAVWAKTHAPSLLNFQTLVQRHMKLPSLWDDYIIPFLEWPAWLDMVAIGVVALLLALLFAVLGYKKPKSGNAFENTPQS